MRLRATLFVVTALVFAALAMPVRGQPVSPQAAAAIRLKAATFTPGKGEKPAIPDALTERGNRPAGKPAMYIVQFAGPIEQAWKDQVAGIGAQLLAYIPDYAFKTRMTPEQAAQVGALQSVAWVGVFEPAYKLSPRLPASGAGVFTVVPEQGADLAALIGAAQQAGVSELSQVSGKLTIAADRSAVDALAASPDVAWIEPYTLFEKHNEYGGGGIIGAAIANASGYNGSTQIAAVADTGLGGGSATTAHRDIPASRIQSIYNWPGVPDSCFQTIYNDGAVDVGSGHGTHVAGSVLSSGDPNTGKGKGVAPSAKLVFQATENYVAVSNLCRAFYGYQNDYYLTGLNDLTGLFQQAYNAGARIHSNSWGSDAAGDYIDTSATTDDFIWSHRDFTITFSAGNAGADANNDGVVDNDSIGAPATAKNVITIGASENDRQGHYECDTALTYTSHDTAYQNGQTCSSMGGQNLLGTPRQRWGFTANPVADDPTAGNKEQMAAFSSRGPTDDGRIKPDVVAPGTWILSTYSEMYQEGYGDGLNPRNNAHQSDGWGMPVNDFYKYFGGTSMANPIAGGAATVVRDFYQKAKGVNASAALVKATLINSAVDMLDENNDGANDNDFPIPNMHEGWGRINLVNATDGTAQFVDNTSGIATGASAGYAYTAAGGAPLKISLVWSDYPSTATAAANLVNNLNLTLTAPNGTLYRGNVFSGGWSATGGSADGVNNVENVYIQSAASGTWTVTVSGANVPNGPQPFALVVDGASAGTTPTATPTSTSVATATPTATTAPTATPTSTPSSSVPSAPGNLTATTSGRTQVILSWADTSSNETGFRIERCTGANCTNFAEIGTVGANVTSATNKGLAKRTTYTYRVRAYNASGNSAYSNTATVTTP